jgi:hypothetical protein
MKWETVIKLMMFIVMCLAGMVVGIMGFLELFDKGMILSADGVSRVPAALAMMLSGIFTFLIMFSHGLDHETWKEDEDE